MLWSNCLGRECLDEYLMRHLPLKGSKGDLWRHLSSELKTLLNDIESNAGRIAIQSCFISGALQCFVVARLPSVVAKLTRYQIVVAAATAVLPTAFHRMASYC